MYKHSTTHRTLSRRLAALLAALALLAAMALPVYAEALDGATQMQETVETDNNGETDNKVEAGSDVKTDDKSETKEDTGTGAESEDTNDDASSSTTGDSNTTADDAVNDTPQTLPADNIDTTAGKTTMDDTLDTTDEDTKQDSVTRSVDDAATDDDASIQPVDEATSNAITYPIMVYFAVPEGFNDSWSVRFNAKKGSNGPWVERKPMTSKSPEYDGRRVFGVELTESECAESNFGTIQFQYFEANTYKDKYEIPTSTPVATIANKLFDAKEKKWVDYKPFDPTNHTAFSGKPMAFKNASTAELTNVVAHFYEKTNGELVEVEPGTHNLGTVSVGATTKPFPIPTAACSYVQFTAGDNKIISSLYNFYGQEVGTGEESFLFDETNCFCFVYTEKASNWTRGKEGRTIFYDATFSKLSLDTANAIPSIVGGDVYYYLTGPNKTALFGKMTKQSDDRYYIDGVDEGYDHIIFAARSTGDNGIKPDNLAKSGESTENLEIPWAGGYAFPCFYADTGDDSTYKSDTNNQRGGYWAEVNTLRDAETNKKTGKAVVDVQQADFKADSSTKYIDTTLYDYYTDWELNGNNRDTYDHNFSEDGNAQNAFSAHRNWVPFRQFDQAVSDYYLSAGAFGSNNSVLYPIYTGHFQPQELDNFKPFAELSGALNLFGFTKGRAFMAANNSALCANTDDNRKDYYDYTFQGIVANQEVNGQPIMRGTENGTNKLVEPHFNEDFLKGNNSKKAKLGDVYEKVSFPFTQADVFGEKVKYWAFDAADTTLYLKQDSSDKSYFLQKSDNRTASENRESNTAVKKDNMGQPTYGFFPFNETIPNGAQASNYNYGFGAKLQFNFTLTENGKVKSDNGEDVPIKFFFSGDDDVWVFIDGKLVLDVGGAHGKASGLLEFGASGDKNTVTPYVSKVKVGGTATHNSDNLGNSNGENNKAEKTITYQGSNNKNEKIDFYYKGDTIEYDKGTTHTLTMYYMERGMWESNMAIAFNFPDYNELQVKKEVDVNGVNDLFKNCFKDKRFFNFTIRNQATHYGTTDAKGDTVTTINLLEPTKSTSDKKDFTTTATHATDTDGENRFTKVNSPPDYLKVTDGTPLLNWYTQFEDLTPSPGSNKEKRYGILALGDGQTFIGGKDLYGQVEMHNNRWITVKLSLDDVKADEGFDEKRVKELRFGCNYPRSIYLRNIVFSSKAVPQTVTGFTTKQEDIADYGSAKEGKLMPAVNAQYTSDAEQGTMVVDKNGGFVLKAGETISFKDQFRRGSYLSINEQVDKNLFDTQWTIYEDGMPVKSTTAGRGEKLKLNGEPISLKDQTGTAPDDGRIELGNAEGVNAQNGNSYKGEKPSTKNKDDNTIVFRSYANPDATDAEGETQLKVVFVNTVKTGSLTIKKEQDGKGENLDDRTYTFRVRFTNVGGHALEDEAIVREYPVTVDKPFTIDKIPVGTRFTIEELTPEDGSKLTNASVTGGGSGTMVLNNLTVRGSIVEGAASDGNQAVATFTNTRQETLDITGEKVWKDANGTPVTSNLPDIYVQLQRRHKITQGAQEAWQLVKYQNQDYRPVINNYGGMKFSFLGLPAKDYSKNDKPDFEYRVVEGYVDTEGFHAVEEGKTITIDEKVYCVTYNPVTVSKPDDSSNNAKQTVTITNRQQDPKFTLDVTKKSAENDGENDQQKLLAGVEFTLEKLNASGQVEEGYPKYGITNDQGKLMIKGEDGNPTNDSAFTGLEAGKYRLTETKAAENYNLLSAPILVTFGKDGTCTLNGSTIKVSAKENKPTEFTKNEDGSYTLALTVLNRKTPALPHTGADAPSLWLLIGLPLAVAGLLILVFRYNKKGGRTR